MRSSDWSSDVCSSDLTIEDDESVQVTTSCGLVLRAFELPSGDEPLDTLVVPGGWGINAACENRKLVEWIRQRSKAARRTASVCSGAFLLAMAGLLDGRRAVTHWQRCAEFADRFPQVRLDPDPIFLCDGDICTSAGVTAGIRSEEHTSELQSLMRNSYAVFCLKKKTTHLNRKTNRMKHPHYSNQS